MAPQLDDGIQDRVGAYLAALACADSQVQWRLTELLRSRGLVDDESIRQLVLLDRCSAEHFEDVASPGSVSLAPERVADFVMRTLGECAVSGAVRDRLHRLLFREITTSAARYRTSPRSADPRWLGRLYLSATEHDLGNGDPFPEESWPDLRPEWWSSLWVQADVRPDELDLRLFAESEAQDDTDLLEFLWDGHVGRGRSVSLVAPAGPGIPARVSQLTYLYWLFRGPTGDGYLPLADLAENLIAMGVRRTRTTAKRLDAGGLSVIWNRAQHDGPRCWGAALRATQERGVLLDLKADDLFNQPEQGQDVRVIKRPSDAQTQTGGSQDE